MSTHTFTSMALSAPIQKSLESLGYTTPSPIQAQSIPSILEGRDLMGFAQTGTGKTAAFALPILEGIAQQQRRPGRGEVRALVLVPTRELAVQVADAFTKYGKNLQVSNTLVYGGVSMGPQTRALARGVDVVIATPGRLLDHLNQNQIDLSRVQYLVLDEVDRMLDMGFIQDVRTICNELPKKRQTLLFSATFAKELKALADSLVNDPVTVSITPETPVVEKIAQEVCFVKLNEKTELLAHLIKQAEFDNGAEQQRTLIFSRTKHGCERISKHLNARGMRSDAIHGNKSQAARQKALDMFRKGKTNILVATDVASRGIDVKNITLVVNYDLPEVAETYVHRIGRTARAEAEGRAVSFVSRDDGFLLRNIQKYTRSNINVREDHPFHDTELHERQSRPFTERDNPNRSRGGFRGRGQNNRRSGPRSSSGGGGGGYRGASNGGGGGYRGASSGGGGGYRGASSGGGGHRGGTFKPSRSGR